MRHAHPDRFAAHRGFTLVESIIVMVLLGIAAAGIVSLQGRIFTGQAANKDMQLGVQLMQECAEQILATRRNGIHGYIAVNNTACSALGNIGGFGAPSVTLTLTGDPNPPNPVTACTSASSTCTATISISKGGSSLTPITLRLVKY
jgi:prepilin-type N-terminal cleavage/methylation domain-containing protein